MIKVLLGKILYRCVGCLLPSSSNPVGGKLGKWFRGFCGRLILNKVGKGINIEKNSCFSRNVTLGNNSGIGKNCYLQGNVTIGKNVMMASNVKVFTTNHETTRTDIPMCQQGSQAEKPVIIGDDVWICDSVIICPGTVVGNGVILGAGAVVRGNIPNYAVVTGNPGQIVKYRRETDE